MSDSSEQVAASVLARMCDAKQDKVQETKKKGGRKKKVAHKFPVEPRVIQVIKKPKSHANHSYRDFSSVPPEIDHVEPTNIQDMTFSQKVHHMLSQKEYQNWISWMPHGRSFKILVPKRLEQAGVLQKYFGHSRFSSFLRQLNNFGFKHITKGPDRNTYYHEVSRFHSWPMAQYIVIGFF